VRFFSSFLAVMVVGLVWSGPGHSDDSAAVARAARDSRSCVSSFKSVPEGKAANGHRLADVRSVASLLVCRYAAEPIPVPGGRSVRRGEATLGRVLAARIARRLNGLQKVGNISLNCPDDNGERAYLSFRYRSSAEPIVVRIALSGCPIARGEKSSASAFMTRSLTRTLAYLAPYRF
jgi:hypothetical protein